MDGLLKNKVAVVTGGGRGIGEEIGLILAENGADVIIADIDAVSAQNAVEKSKKFGVKSIFVDLDVMKTEEINEKINYIVEKFGRIDIWVNNAGIAQDIPIEEISEKDWDNMMGINLKGVFFCSQAVFKLMKKQKGGKIINISSLAGMRGGRFAGAHYSAAKGGVNILTKCFALRGGEYNINVNAIAPGLILTKMADDLGWVSQDHKDIPLGRLGTVNDVAKTVLFLSSHLSDYITGEIINLNGGMYMD